MVVINLGAAVVLLGNSLFVDESAVVTVACVYSMGVENPGSVGTIVISVDPLAVDVKPVVVISVDSVIINPGPVVLDSVCVGSPVVNLGSVVVVLFINSVVANQDL